MIYTRVSEKSIASIRGPLDSLLGSGDIPTAEEVAGGGIRQSIQ